MSIRIFLYNLNDNDFCSKYSVALRILKVHWDWMQSILEPWHSKSMDKSKWTQTDIISLQVGQIEAMLHSSLLKMWMRHLHEHTKGRKERNWRKNNRELNFLVNCSNQVKWFEVFVQLSYLKVTHEPVELFSLLPLWLGRCVDGIYWRDIQSQWAYCSSLFDSLGEHGKSNFVRHIFRLHLCHLLPPVQSIRLYVGFGTTGLA